MSSLSVLLLSAVVIGATAIKIADMEQGAEFTKCVSISDFQTKMLADDITLLDRLANGCCPKDSVPGKKWVTGYKGAQIVCGFKADGTIATSTTSGTNAKCTYNKCYVDKQNLACADDTKQLLNGCCAATTKANTGFPALCKNYFQTITTVNKDKVNYCTTYHKNYGTVGRAGTTVKTDDQADGKLQPDKIDTYATCAGGSGAGASGAGTGATTGATTTTSGVGHAAVGMMGVFASIFAHTMWL
jgi:hypothetical protein